MNDNKQKALDAALSQIERQFGKGSIMKLGDNKALNIDGVPFWRWGAVERLGLIGMRGSMGVCLLSTDVST